MDFAARGRCVYEFDQVMCTSGAAHHDGDNAAWA